MPAALAEASEICRAHFSAAGIEDNEGCYDEKDSSSKRSEINTERLSCVAGGEITHLDARQLLTDCARLQR